MTVDPAESGVEEGGESGQGTRFSIGLRAEGPGLFGSEDGSQARQGIDQRLDVGAQGIAGSPGEHRVDRGATGDVADHSIEHLQGPLGHLVDPLPAQHPDALLGAPLGQLLEQGGLAPARGALHHDQSAPALPDPAHLGLDGGQLGVPTDERRSGERSTGVLGADDHIGSGIALLEGHGDLAEVGERGVGRGVPVRRFLHQQALHDLVERAGDGPAQAAQAGHRLGHVLAEHLAHGVALEHGSAGQALEEHSAHRIQVRALVDLVGHQAGRLR